MSRDDMRRALVALRVACDDADAVTRDLLAPLRKRELGPVLARQNYSEARGKITESIAYLLTLAAEDPDHGDPSGIGGAGPVH